MCAATNAALPALVERKMRQCTRCERAEIGVFLGGKCSAAFSAALLVSVSWGNVGFWKGPIGSLGVRT